MYMCTQEIHLRCWSIQAGSSFFKSLLEGEKNRATIVAALKNFIPTPQLKIVGEDTVVTRSEEEETSEEAAPEIGSGALERKVIDMFNGEKLK